MSNFWQGKKVFVTGHTGFKGGWLVLWLEALGAEVRGYSLAAPSAPNLFALAEVARGMDSIEGDIREAGKLAAAMRAQQPEIVFHLAAQPLVRQSYADPLATYAVNVMGTANLLDAARHCPSVRAAVVITTDKCYENREWLWPYRESDRLGGHDPYSSSKACAEVLASSFRRAFFADGTVATARAGNVIGGGDWAADRLVPDMVRAFSAGEALVLRNPEAVRPWQHVLEPLRGYLLLAERLYTEGQPFAEAWNFGPESSEARPVSWLAERFAELWGNGAAWRHAAAEQPHEAQMLTLDWSKAAARLDWHPLLPLDESLAWTAEWYSRWRKGEPMRAFTLQQLSLYRERAARGVRA